jgi:chromosome segregation ATPase
MFSKELQILDRNTVKYMIDELQEQLDDTKVQLDDAKVQLDDAKKELISKDKYIAELEAQLKDKN